MNLFGPITQLQQLSTLGQYYLTCTQTHTPYLNYFESKVTHCLTLSKNTSLCISKNKLQKRTVGIFHLAKVCLSVPPKVSISCKGKTSNYIVQKTDRCYLIQVSKVHITSNKIYWHPAPRIRCTEKNTISILGKSCQKLHHLSPIMRKHQTDLNWETLYKIVRIMKE